jgi:hypothetical protein
LLQTPKNVVRPESVVENSDVITNIPNYTEPLNNNSDSDSDSSDSESVFLFESRIDNKSLKKNKRKLEAVNLKSQKKKIKSSNSKSKKKKVIFSDAQRTVIESISSKLMITEVVGQEFKVACSEISTIFTKLAINNKYIQYKIIYFTNRIICFIILL